MAGKTDSSTEVPEGFIHVGLHMVTTNTDGSGHLHLASLYHLKLEKKNPNPVILLDRVTHFKGKKKKKSKNPLCPSKKRIYMCLNYVSFISESGNRQRDYAKLTNIAFADALTGLANRAKADSVFEELDRSREDYCLVSVDVNGLKETNDRLGHSAGDRLLKDYASALKASFGDEMLCARMGGDEFLVIMKKTNADGFGVRLRRLYSDLDEMNMKDKSIFRSAAIGYAFRHECHSKDAHSVYLLADERMFENKREQHIRYRIRERS